MMLSLYIIQGCSIFRYQSLLLIHERMISLSRLAGIFFAITYDSYVDLFLLSVDLVW